MKKIFYLPSHHLSLLIGSSMLLGLIVSNYFFADYVRVLMPFSIMAMVLPTMIGFQWKEIAGISHSKLFIAATVINFILIPLLAYGLGTLWLSNEPELFAGLALASLLPTSGMTISWTMLYKGNVSASIKITALSLIIGGLITPFYLTIMFGQGIEANLMFLIMKVVIVIILPMIIGGLIHRSLLNKYSNEEYTNKIRPMFPIISSWGLIAIIFVMTSLNGSLIFDEISLLFKALLLLVVFYIINFFISTVIGRLFFKKEETISLVYSTVLRNLSIALGIALTAFGPKAGLMLALAFLLQIQAATWFGRLNNRFGFLK